MPDFYTAYRKTMGHEGGWSSNGADRGGETIMGISRVAHPTWSGWGLVDELKNAQGVPNLNQAAALPLTEMVEGFYKQNFWNPCGCHQFTSQDLAEEMFDSAVNCGGKTAVKWLQEGVNLLRFKDDALVAVDGVMGGQTMAMVGKVGARHNLPRLVKLLNVMQGAHYLELARRDPSQRQFLIGGWLNRVTV